MGFVTERVIFRGEALPGLKPRPASCTSSTSSPPSSTEHVMLRCRAHHLDLPYGPFTAVCAMNLG